MNALGKSVPFCVNNNNPLPLFLSYQTNSTGSLRWVCRVEFEDHIQSLIYVMFLIVVCTLLAMKAHGIITNHREGIFIGLSAGFSIPVRAQGSPPSDQAKLEPEPAIE